MAHRKLAGTYQVKCGPVFYIGSTSDLTKRKSDHLSRLKWKEHPNPRLQEAFNEHGTFEFVICEYFFLKDGETPEEFKARYKAAEQVKLDECFKDPLFKDRLANRSTSATHNSGISEFMKQRWQDSEFREESLARLRESRKLPISEATREKMRVKKQGANNVKSRACILSGPEGEIEFACNSDAAKFLKVSQQAMHQWATGVLSWPGTGKRGCRPHYAHVAAYSFRWKD